ncbi:MAG TPA: hypothetical protein VIL35_14595 [Vicinamibacterales bacterium]
MLRVVERMFGEGQLWHEGIHVLDAGYQMSLYREWRDEAGTLTPGGFVIDGHVMAPPEALSSLLFTTTPLTLRLEDGRQAQIYIVSEDGSIASADDRGVEERA